MRSEACCGPRGQRSFEPGQGASRRASNVAAFASPVRRLLTLLWTIDTSVCGYSETQECPGRFMSNRCAGEVGSSGTANGAGLSSVDRAKARGHV